MLATARNTAVDHPRLPSSTAGLGAAFFAASIALCYTIRGTILVYNFGDVVAGPIATIAVVAIVAAALYVSLGGLGRLSYCGSLMVCVTGASLLVCDRFDFAWPRWLGWVLLIWSVGPISVTRRHCQLRAALAANLDRLLLWCTIASFAWWAFGLPSLGRGTGYLTGVMWQSMLLAPISAMVAVRALCIAISTNNNRWYAIFLVSLLTCTLASSRAALAALAAAIAVILVVRLKRAPIVATLAALPIAAFAGFMAISLMHGDGGSDGHIAAGLQRKSFVNSRENHWRDRLDEFQSSPWLGVGFASAWEDTKGFNEESGTVETGSSYIAILSMTGLCGMIAFGLLMTNLLWRVWMHGQILPQEKRLQVYGMAAFWLVHLGAEGYIYASGSLLGLLFWSWMGSLHDSLQNAESTLTLARPTPRHSDIESVQINRPYTCPTL